MGEYLIVPYGEATWSFERRQLREQIEARWPGSDIREGSFVPGVNMLLHGRIATTPRVLSFDVNENRSIHLEPELQEEAAEVIAWLTGVIPEFEPEVRLYSDEYNQYLPLRSNMSAAEVLAYLSNNVGAMEP